MPLQEHSREGPQSTRGGRYEVNGNNYKVYLGCILDHGTIIRQVVINYDEEVEEDVQGGIGCRIMATSFGSLYHERWGGNDFGL